MSDASDLFREWRTADKVAHELEKRLLQQAMASIDGTGEPPPLEDKEKARRLREIANDLFLIAMAEMKRQAGLLDRSRGGPG